MLYSLQKRNNCGANCHFSFAEVASQYGRDDFSAVTVEDLAMEVKSVL